MMIYYYSTKIEYLVKVLENSSNTYVHMMSKNAVNCPSHPTVPWDSGTFHGMSTCPSTDACMSHCQSHPMVGQWDCPSHPTVPWDSGTFHGMSTCPFTDACVSHCQSHPMVGQWDCPSHPTVPWDSGTFHGMSTCPAYRYSHCSFHSTIP